MNELLRSAVRDKKRMQEILGISRAQAWRIWTGKSKLTSINEKYLWKVLSDKGVC